MTATLYTHPALLRAFLEPNQRLPEAREPAHPWTRLGEDEDRLLTAAKRLDAQVRWLRGAGRAGPAGEWCADVPPRDRMPGARLAKASKGELADALEMVLWVRGDEGIVGRRGALGEQR